MKTVPFRIEVGAQSVELGFVRHRKARRYILRLLPGGIARVTIPRGGSLEHAAEFARKNTAWLEKQLRRSPPAWGDGTEILFRGIPIPIRLAQTGQGWHASVGGVEVRIRSLEELRPAIEAQLRALATPELAQRTWQLAREQGLEVRSVSVRDQRSRWGSCSVRRTICLNYKLIQTPEFVRDYIIIHELMHLREMNHSARFWALVEAACPGFLEAERWLKKNGRLLR